MSRTTEMILGILSGIIGFGGAFFALFIGVADEAVNGSSEVSGLAIAAFVFSILAIVGGVWVKFNAKIGGWMMIVSGIGGTISISLFFLLPLVLLLAGGIMALVRKEKKRENLAA